MSENTRLDIDSNIPQQLDKIGKAVDSTAKKLDKLGSGSAFEELQRTMKAVSNDFKSFGGTVDKAFEKALKNLDNSAMPNSVRDVYRTALVLAKSGSKELTSEYEKLSKSAESAASRVAAAEDKIAKAKASGRTYAGAQKELKTASGILASLEGKFADARENAKNLKFFHLQLRDALNKEYNEFYLKRQATQKTANLQELQAFKDLGVKLQGEDAALYKRLLKAQKDFNSSVAAEARRAKAQSAMPYSEVSTGAVKNQVVQGPPRELFTQAKTAEKDLTSLAEKDQQFLNRYKNATKALESDNATRAKSLLDYTEVVRNAAEQSELLATKKFGSEAVQFSKSAEAQKLATKVAETEAAKLLKVQKEKAIAISKPLAELAQKDQEFVNRYKNATSDFDRGNKARAESLRQYLSVVKAVADTSPDYATKKFGTAAVTAAIGVEFDSLNKKLADTQNRMPPLLSGFKALGGRLIDVHSATRGLASGFNLLWLTWGQMGPLFAGAAVSMGTKSIVTMGAQIGHQLEIIKVLSEESDSAVSGLNAQLLHIAETGPYGPLQVAEALKTLSLAGLDATQAAKALPRVLQFAAAGTTSIEKAADVMTGVATAFGYTAENFNLVGDIITKTAAVSKAGIEDMGEAFKAASVVSTQFGVSIKDVSLLLALQANLNIKNSAAGTNVRNLYTDLSGRSKEARKLMKELNLELTDSSGRFKDVVTLAKELDGALSKFTGKGSRDVQLRLLGERGGKAIVPVLAAYRTEVREVSVVNGQMVETVTNQLEQLKKKTEDSYGFMALAAAKLSMTPLKQMESVVSTFQSSIVKAFEGMEDEVIITSDRLKEVFKSPEFASALKNLVAGVASLTEALLGNLDVVGKVVLGYVGFKVLATTASMFIGLNSAIKAGTEYLAAYSAQQAKSSAVNAAASVASNGVAVATAAVGSNLLKAIPIIGTVVSIGTAAWSMWELYNLTQGKTADVTKAAADGIKKSGIIEALDSENERLLKQLAILDLSLKKKRQISEQEFDNMNKADEAAASEAKRVAGAVAEARALEAKASAIRVAAAKTEEAHKKNLGLAYVRPPEIELMYKQAAEIDAARKKINTAAIKSEVETKVERNRINNKAVSEKTDQLNQTLRDLKITGTKTFDPDTAGGATKNRAFDRYASSLTRMQAAIKSQTADEKQLGEATISRLDSTSKREIEILEARHKAGLLAEGSYQAELIRITSSAEEEKLKAIEDTRFKVAVLNAEELSQQVHIRDLALKDFKGTAEARLELEESHKEKISAILKQILADNSTYESAKVKVKEDSLLRVEKAEIEHQGKLIKLQQETDKYLADLKGERSKEVALTSLNKQYENVNDSSVIWLQAEKSGAVAAAEAVGKHEAQLRAMTLEYEKVSEAADALAEANRKLSAEGWDLPELAAAAKQMQAEKKAMEVALGKFRKEVNEDVANQGAIAYNESFRKRANEFKNTVAETLAEALVSGANNGGQSLRKILEAELKAPFVLMFRMSLDALLGDLGKAAGSVEGGSGGSGGLSNALSTLSSASTLSTAYKALSGAIEGSIGKSFEKFAMSDIGSKLGLSSANTYSLSGSGANLGAMNGGSGLTSGSGGSGMQASGTEGFKASLGETTTSLTELGSTLKTVGTNLAATFAGQALRKGISGGYSVGGAGETAMDIAAVIASLPGIGGPIASLVTGAVSGLINRTFGRKLKDTGIQGSFGSEGFSGSSYKFYKGGLLRSDKTKTSALDQETTNTFTNTFRSIQASTAVLATNMGLSANAALAFKKDIKISLKGLDADAQNAALTKMFSEVQDDMAKAVLDAWGDWSIVAKYGETASEVLTNVSNNLTGFNGMLELLDLKLIDVTLNGAAAASSIIEAAGGIEAITNSYGSYYENFYSEAERNSKAIETLGEKFKSLGVQMPNLIRDSDGFVTNGEKAKETFRALVTAAAEVGNLSLATELVKLSNDFNSVATAVNNAADSLNSLKDSTKTLEAELLKAQGNTEAYATAIRAIETVDMTAQEKAVYDYNSALQTELDTLEQLKGVRKTAAEAEIRLLEAQGFTTKAEEKRRAVEIDGMTEAQVAAYDYAAAVDKQVEVFTKAADVATSVQSAEIKLLQAQGKTTEATRQQRILDIKSLTAAEIAAYDYTKAIEEQVSTLEKAADFKLKFADVFTSLREYLSEFGKSTTSFSGTVTKALSGDFDAMGKVTAEADKAIALAKQSSRSSSEFAAKQAGILSQVAKVANFADTLSKETDTDKIINAVKGSTATSAAVDNLGTRLSANDIAVSLNATLQTVKKSNLASGEITAIEALFTDMKATVTAMSLSDVASNNGQTILGMFNAMRATVLTVMMSAAPTEVAKVTSVFDALTAFVSRVNAAGISEASVQAAVGTSANITSYVTRLAAYGLSDASAQHALGNLANIASYVTSIQTIPGNNLGQQFISALAAYSSIGANIVTITTSPGVPENKKSELQWLLSGIAANINSITTAPGISEEKKASLSNTLSNISAVVTSINTASGVEAAIVNSITNNLDSFQAVISNIAVTAPDSNIKALLVGKADTVYKSLSLAAAMENGGGSFGLSAAEAKTFLDSTTAIKKYLEVYGGTVSLSDIQKEALLESSGTIVKTVEALQGLQTLTPEQKLALSAPSDTIRKTIEAIGGSDTVSPIQRIALTTASGEVYKLVSAYGWGDTLTPTQRTALTASNSEVTKWVTALAGGDTLTPDQRTALTTANSEVTKWVTALAGHDWITPAQREALLGANSEVTKWVTAAAGGETLTPTQRTALTTANSEVTKWVTAAAGSDLITPAQREALLGSSSTITKTVAVTPGSDWITPAQREALLGADSTITKTVTAVGGNDNLTDAQKTLLGIINGTKNGVVNVNGSVGYEPTNEMDRLMTNLTTAMGKVGIEQLTTKIGTLVSAIDAQVAQTQKDKDLATAQRKLSEAASAQASKIAEVNQGISNIWALAKQYGVYLNADQGPLNFSNTAKFAVNDQGLFDAQYNQVTYKNGAAYQAFLNAFYASGGAYQQTYGKSQQLSEAAAAVESARALVRSLGGVPQFATGGYTGPGSVNDLAGVVHKGEVVWSQSDIANAGGLATVEAMRAGYMPYAQEIPAPAVTYAGSTSTISLDESAILEELKAVREELFNMRYEVRATAVNTGKAAKHLKEFDDRGMKVKNADSGSLEVTTV